VPAPTPAAPTPAAAATAAAAGPPPFDLDRSWRLHPQVALRPEPFGALAYHFGTRRLSFLKDRDLLRVVRVLGDHPTARDACVAAGVPAARMPAFARALATLAGSQMIAPGDVSAGGGAA
jgi:putative mycofactocin binding protein MftB